jgi:hypothetical protein
MLLAGSGIPWYVFPRTVSGAYSPPLDFRMRAPPHLSPTTLPRSRPTFPALYVALSFLPFISADTRLISQVQQIWRDVCMPACPSPVSKFRVSTLFKWFGLIYVITHYRYYLNYCTFDSGKVIRIHYYCLNSTSFVLRRSSAPLDAYIDSNQQETVVRQL